MKGAAPMHNRADPHGDSLETMNEANRRRIEAGKLNRAGRLSGGAPYSQGGRRRLDPRERARNRARYYARKRERAATDPSAAKAPTEINHPGPQTPATDGRRRAEDAFGGTDGRGDGSKGSEIPRTATTTPAETRTNSASAERKDRGGREGGPEQELEAGAGESVPLRGTRRSGDGRATREQDEGPFSRFARAKQPGAAGMQVPPLRGEEAGTRVGGRSSGSESMQGGVSAPKAILVRTRTAWGAVRTVRIPYAETRPQPRIKIKSNNQHSAARSAEQRGD